MAPADQTQKRVIIFESYAWNDSQELAKRLRRDLTARDPAWRLTGVRGG